jgi:hypothetical protein
MNPVCGLVAVHAPWRGRLTPCRGVCDEPNPPRVEASGHSFRVCSACHGVYAPESAAHAALSAMLPPVAE